MGATTIRLANCRLPTRRGVNSLATLTRSMLTRLMAVVFVHPSFRAYSPATARGSYSGFTVVAIGSVK
jgi:hypothetical protein